LSLQNRDPLHADAPALGGKRICPGERLTGRNPR
jgi:hypothetical protein